MDVVTTPFAPAGRDGNFRHNAVLVLREDDAWLGFGFASAADTLVESWENRGPNDGHLMPIITLYRHGLELLLKACIRDAAACLRRDGDPDPQLGKAALDEWLARRAGHSLQSLANRLDDYLNRLNEEKLPPDTHAVLMSIHTLDPGGDTFRYATTWDKSTKTFVPAPRPGSTHINVVEMGRAFSEAASLIGGGVLTILDLHAEYQQEMLRDAGF